MLLTHPRSKVGICSNPRVHVATSTDYVIGLLKGSPMEADRVAQLEQLIVRNHRLHEARRSH